MRFGTLLVLLVTAMVTQSCRIEMPPLVEILSKYEYGIDNSNTYNFSKSKAVVKQGGFRDTLIIGDNPESNHGILMREIMERARIPSEHIVTFFEFAKAQRGRYNQGLLAFSLEEWQWLREATRVVHLPRSVSLAEKEDPPRVAESNILFVLSAGNVRSWFKGDRDFYNINHALWNYPDDLETDQRHKYVYRNMLKSQATGKVIKVTSAKVTRTGAVEPYQNVVSCGDFKESCFAVVPAQQTSMTSARLAAMSFYLAQFWETPEEMVEVLKQCAIDVGEPGVDREYGQGVANLLCPPILKKELEVVSSYLEETEEISQTEGGTLEGEWMAESTVLQVHLPEALQTTLQIQYAGEVVGTVAFTKNTVQADFRAEATVNAVCLTPLPLEATATEVVEVKGAYTTVQDTLHIPGDASLTYTATKDSLHLVRSLTLNEALALLPDPLGSMVDMASEDFFVEDPIQIRMSFAKKPTLPGDFDENNLVDFADFLLFVNAFGTSAMDTAFDERMDLVSDGMINFADFLVFVTLFSENS